MLTSEGIPLHSNGDVTSSDSNGSVNGAAADGVDGPQANGGKGGEEMTSAEAVPSAPEANGSVEELEAIYTKGVVARMLREADEENAFIPPENAFTPPETAFTAAGDASKAEIVGETAKANSVEDEEGARFADSVLLEEPDPAATIAVGVQGSGTTPSGGKQSKDGGQRGKGTEPTPEMLGGQANEGRNSAHSSGKRGDGNGSSPDQVTASEATPKTSATANVGSSAAIGSAASRADGTPPRAKSNERSGSGSESRKRTAADVRRENRTAQKERAGTVAPAAVRAEPKGGVGVKRHLMGSTPAPALVSQPGASQVADVQVTSALDERSGEKLDLGGKEQGVGKSGRVRGGASGAPGLASGSRDESALEPTANSDSPGDSSLRGVNGGVPETAARGKKRSTHHTSDSTDPGASGGGLSEGGGVFAQGGGVFAQDGGDFAQGGGAFTQDGGTFKQKSQLEELSRLLSNRPLKAALDGDVWDSVLGTGSPNLAGLGNPPLPDESFLEDEDLEAPSQPEPLFLPTEKAGPFGGFSLDGAPKSESGVNTDAAAGKSESTGPFGLGSVPFTPIFTSQPSGKESGRVKHGSSNSGLARGFFGPTKAKRKSDKRSVRAPEVVPNFAPPREETPSVSAGIGEEFGGDAHEFEGAPEFGGGFSETPQQFLEVPVDELVLTTDTSTDEKKSSGSNVKPKGFADLIENEDLLREVGKSADQRLRSVVKGKVETKAKQGRNDVCNCGSGKKWKKCHGKGMAA